MNKQYMKFILSSEELLTIDTQKAEAPLKFATSDNAFAIDGWVPVSEFESFREKMLKATGDRIYVTKVEPEPKASRTDIGVHEEHHEIDAPVKYANPGWMHAAEGFIDLYARPLYSEIDPTALYFIGFPLFYGFILGDIGYGLIILLIALIVKNAMKYSEGWQMLATAGIYCSISSIIFGFIFGEFLGFNMAEAVEEGGGFLGFTLAGLYPHAVHIGPVGPFSLPLERLVAGGFHNGSYVFGIKDLLVFCCLVGVAQLLLGYALGFRNELKQHGLKAAVLHKCSWAFMLIGGVCMVWYVFPLMIAGMLSSFNVANPLFLIGGAAFLLGFVLLLMGEGSWVSSRSPT